MRPPSRSRRLLGCRPRASCEKRRRQRFRRPLRRRLWRIRRARTATAIACRLGPACRPQAREPANRPGCRDRRGTADLKQLTDKVQPDNRNRPCPAAARFSAAAQLLELRKHQSTDLGDHPGADGEVDRCSGGRRSARPGRQQRPRLSPTARSTARAQGPPSR